MIFPEGRRFHVVVSFRDAVSFCSVVCADVVTCSIAVSFGMVPSRVWKLEAYCIRYHGCDGIEFWKCCR